MKREVIEAEALTLQSAREKAAAMTPPGFQVLSETILSDGEPQTIRVAALSSPAAFEEARKRVPSGVDEIEEREVKAATSMDWETESFDEETARSHAHVEFGGTGSIESISMKAKGSRGLLGIGRRPNIYQVRIRGQAIVEISYRPRARLRIETADVPSIAYCQMCGRQNAPASRLGNGMQYFCAADCQTRYLDTKISASLFGRGLLLNMSGQDFGNAIAAARTATSRCWSCGLTVPITQSKCDSCGVPQELT